MMDLQQFWKRNASDPTPALIDSAVIAYFMDSLSAELDVPIEIYLEEPDPGSVFIRWRTQTTHAGVLGLALEGLFSITLGEESPQVAASLFVFSGEHKLFPQSAEQGYLDLTYQPQQGWQKVAWYSDEFSEFDDKRYSGTMPVHGPIVIPHEPDQTIIPTLLQQLFTQTITITPGERTCFTSTDPLFGMLAISFAGEVNPLDEHPRGFEVTVRLQSGDQPLAVGPSEQRERVLQVQSSDSNTWNCVWKEQSEG